MLLDAKSHLGKGKALEPGQMVTAADINAMIEAQGLSWRGILPGDVVYIYTGWGDNWEDPDNKKEYYTKGPGLSEDGAKLLEEKRVRPGGAGQSVHGSRCRWPVAAESHAAAGKWTRACPS